MTQQEEYNEKDYFWFKGKPYKRGNRQKKEKDIAELTVDLGLELFRGIKKQLNL